ncbi:MAG: YbhB/YbcL family Raf kinase inhibitor-like protein [Nanoarchaeota archaeon]
MRWLPLLLLFLASCSSPTGEEGIVDQTAAAPSTPLPEVTDMKLSSTAFQPNQTIPAKYTCDGQGISPPLSVSGIPPATKAFALVVEDPDAPMGIFTHWVAWNIPVRPQIGEDADFTYQGKNSFGDIGYGGPCPPNGKHRYVFKLFALDAQLSLYPSADRKQLESAMEGHILAQAELVGVYSR